MKRQDEQAARVALGAHRNFERGNTDDGKQRLLRAIGSYYRLYHAKGGDTNLLAQIDKAAQEHPALATELSRNLNDGKK